MSERVSLRQRWPRRSMMHEVVGVVEFLAGRILARSVLNWFDGSVVWQFLHWAFDMFCSYQCIEIAVIFFAGKKL